METSEQKCGVTKEAGVSFVNDKMRYGHVAELVSQNQQQSSICLKLKTQKEATTDGTEMEEVVKALTEAMRARVSMKKSGPKHAQFRREMCNGHVASSRQQLHDLEEESLQMERYKTLTHNIKNEGTGKMHHQNDKDEE